MSEENGTHYPDLPPDGLGDLQKIERIRNFQRMAPQIRWGDDYRSWPIEKRLRYAENLASSMNHAADLLQKERNALLKTAMHQEAQLKMAVQRYDEQGDLMRRELGRADAEKQDLYRQIVALQAASAVGRTAVVVSHVPKAREA